MNAGLVDTAKTVIRLMITLERQQRVFCVAYTGWRKKMAHFLRLITSSNIDQFSNFFFTFRVRIKFVIGLSLKITLKIYHLVFAKNDAFGYAFYYRMSSCTNVPNFIRTAQFTA